MDIPKPLRFISIILIVLGAIRLVAGVLGLFGLNGTFDENQDLVTQILIENFIASTFILISGLLLLKGKAIGRILLIITVAVSCGAIFIISKEYSLGSLVVFIAIIAVLFSEDSIKKYFAKKE